MSCSTIQYVVYIAQVFCVPLQSPGSTRTPAVVASAPPATNNEEDEHGMMRTVHCVYI